MKLLKSIRKRKKSLFYAFLGSFLLAGTTSFASAAEVAPEFDLEQVVVTATKTPVKAFDTKANVSVISREQLEQRHYQNVSEALRDVPGVVISNYGAHGYVTNTIRINGAEQIVVLIDGIRVNTNASTFSLFQASELNNMDNIERIEVLKGSASTLYGSDAKGGVINIITRKSDNSNKSTVTMAKGSYGQESYSFRNQGKVGDYSWVISTKKDLYGTYSDANGIDVPAHQDTLTTSVQLNKKINDKSDLTFKYDEYKSDYMRSGSSMKLDERHYGTQDNYKVSAIYNYRFDDKIQNQFIVFSNRNRLQDDIGTVDYWQMDLETRGFQDQYTRKYKKHTLVAGFDFYQDIVHNYYGDWGYTVFGDKTVTNRALYLQDEWNMSKQWSLITGARFDNHSVYGNHTTPSITLGFAPNEKTNYYVSYKEFFVSPNMYQLYSSYGNPDLKAETGHTVEGGINHSFDNTLQASFHIFNRHAEDVIAYAYSGGKYRYVNKDIEDAHGWDLQFTKKWSDKFSTNIGYTYTYIEAPTGQTENINGNLPKGMWNIGLNYQQKKYDLSLFGRGIIDKPGPKADTASFPATTYWLWDFAADYKLTKDTKVFLKVNNIFNQEYAEYSGVAYGGQPGEWYLSPGRNYQVGIQHQF